MLNVSDHNGGTFQEIRFSLDGGGPNGMEVIFHTDQHGVAIKVWQPFNHEWVTINTKSLVYHGDSRK